MPSYASTLRAAPEVKDHFYDQLNATNNRIPASEHVYLLGDFNARVGADTVSPGQDCWGITALGSWMRMDRDSWSFCCFHNLRVTNTYFQNRDRHKASWRHPRSNHWHQLDLVITKAGSINNVCITRAYHSADCDTDHSLGASWVKVTPKRFHYAKKKCQPRINTNQTLDPEKNALFIQRLGWDPDQWPITECCRQMELPADHHLQHCRSWCMARRSARHTD